MSAGLAPSLVLGEVVEVESSVTRHKVRLQRLDMPKGVETDWLSVVTAMASDSAGLLFTPEVGDVAVVAFAGQRPIVLGYLFGGGMSTPTDTADEKVIQSRDGSALVLVDGDESGVTLRDQHKNEIKMTKAGITITTEGDLIIEAKGTTTVKGKTVELNP
ncbi:MAG: phage baseplate assembly protein V [Acidimicrobiia bacterium]